VSAGGILIVGGIVVGIAMHFIRGEEDDEIRAGSAAVHPDPKGMEEKDPNEIADDENSNIPSKDGSGIRKASQVGHPLEAEPAATTGHERMSTVESMSTDHVPLSVQLRKLEVLR